MFLDGGGGNRPDNSLPGYPVDPGFGVGAPPVDPGYGRPDYGGGRPDNSLPIAPGRPSHPIHWPPVTPDNTLPGEVPVVSLPIILPEGGTKPVEPDTLFELKWSPIYGWVLVLQKDDEAESK
jgi:hypothetical protein